jgi:hypothetical protein
MDRIQLIAILVTSLLFLSILELVRRRRLMERYALLWLLSSSVLLVLAVWTGLLQRVADMAGIQVPSNALFVVGFAFVLALLLHFSLAISRLSDETKVLAQEVARLQHELRDVSDKQSPDPAAIGIVTGPRDLATASERRSGAPVSAD